MYQISFVLVLKSGEQPDLCVAGEGTLMTPRTQVSVTMNSLLLILQRCFS